MSLSLIQTRPRDRFISHPVNNERFTFSPNAIGVGANVGTALIAPAPMALGLNVSIEAA